jgi:hypothetical protein
MTLLAASFVVLALAADVVLVVSAVRLEVCGSAASEGIRAAQDGRVEAHELPALETAVHAAIETLHRLIREAQAAVGSREAVS